MSAATLPKVRMMTAAEVHGLMKRPPGVPGNKAVLLQAIRGVMTETEADELERRINEMCERIDDGR